MLKLLKKLCLKWHIDWRFVKFLFVGGVNTVFGYSAFALFIFLQMHYAVANFLSIVLSIIFNFFTTGFFVFSNTNMKLFYKFLLVYGFNWGLGSSIMWGCERLGYSNFYVIGAILVLPMAMVSFFLMKKFVFTKG